MANLDNPMVLDAYWVAPRQPDAIIHCRGGFDQAEPGCRDCLERVECAESRDITLPPEWPGCTDAPGECVPDECCWTACPDRAVEDKEAGRDG